MLKIYLAGPMTGLSASEVLESIQYKINRLKGFHVLHPMIGKAVIKEEGVIKARGYQNPIVNDHHIMERDKWMVENSNVVLADLRGSKCVSIGTCMELAWAHIFRKYTVVLMEEGNPHDHCFIKEAADIIFTDVDEALEYLNDFNSGKV